LVLNHPGLTLAALLHIDIVIIVTKDYEYGIFYAIAAWGSA